MPTVLLIPLTSQQDALRFPGTVLIEATQENGLRQDSVARVFQLTAMDKRYLRDRLGQIPATLIAQLWQAFDDLTGRS